MTRSDCNTLAALLNTQFGAVALFTAPFSCVPGDDVWPTTIRAFATTFDATNAAAFRNAFTSSVATVIGSPFGLACGGQDAVFTDCGSCFSPVSYPTATCGRRLL